MKRVIIILLAFVMCLSLCGCGKSEAVKNVEAMIDAIGEVTLDSEAAVVAAEEAYAALTAEEKEKVENYAVMTDARAALDPIIAEELARQEYYGTWVGVKTTYTNMTLNSDTKFELTDTGIIFGDTYIREEIDGLVRLVNEDRSNCLVREEDLTTTEIEITMDNWQDYFELKKQVGNLQYNDFGELAYFELNWQADFKEDILDRLVNTSFMDHDQEKYKIAIEIVGDGGNKWAKLDPETLAGGVDPNWISQWKDISKMGGIDQSNIFYLIYGDFGPGHYPDAGLVPLVNIGTANWDDKYSPEWYYMFNYIPEPEIVRLKGTLLLYDKPVHQK